MSCTEFRWDYQARVKPRTSSASRSNNMLTIVPTTYYLRNAEFRSFSWTRVSRSSYDHNQLEIDTLIGLDHYWKITTREVVHGKSGPTAIGTSLGWVLSGPIDSVPMDDSKP